MTDYLGPYQSHADRHGTGFDVTLWASPESQRLRFDVLNQMCYLPGKRLLDAGCSRGDFAAFLLERDVMFDRYIGVDGLETVVEFAKKRGLERCEFHEGDLVANPAVMKTGAPQIVTISGTLNTMNEDQVLKVLDGAWTAASETLLFNFLSDRAGPGAAVQVLPARRHSVASLMDWALAKTWAVTFRQDYFQHGHDATIMMRKV